MRNVGNDPPKIDPAGQATRNPAPCLTYPT